MSIPSPLSPGWIFCLLGRATCRSIRMLTSPSDPKCLTPSKRVRKRQTPRQAWGRPVGSPNDAKTIIDQGLYLWYSGSEFVGLSKQFAECAAAFDQLLGEVNGQPADSNQSPTRAY